MSETAVELSNQNDLFWNLLTGIRPDANNSSPHVTDTDFVQSEISKEEVENNPSNIPFQEILGQQIINLTAHNTVNPQKPKHPAIESSTTKLFQVDIHEVNPSILPETLLSDSTQRSAKNPNILSSFEGGIDGLSSLTEKDGKGLHLNPAGEQILDAINSSHILPTAFIEHQETARQSFRQNPSLKNGVIDENGNGNTPFIFNTDHQKNFSPSPAFEGKLRKIDIQKNVSFYPPINSHPSMRREFDTQSWHDLPPPGETEEGGVKLLQNFENLQKLDQSLPIAIQEPEFSGSNISDIDTVIIKELPTAFKLRAQDISTENRLNTPMPEINSHINVTEKHMENDLSKITDKVSSEDDIPDISQTNEERHLFDNFTQEKSASHPTPFDIHTQKIHGRYPYPVDTQTMTDDIPSDTTNFPQNTEIFPGSGTTPSLSTENPKEGVSHTLHGNPTASREHTYNIMDQLFQKISLINHGDKSEIKLHLTPPELGNVKIHFTEENDEIEAKIFVENAEVKAVIENNAHRLKESVAANGVEIHKLEVHIQNNNEYKQKSSENTDSNSQHFPARSQEDRNEGQSGNERDVSNNVQPEININTSNLKVDYII